MHSTCIFTIMDLIFPARKFALILGRWGWGMGEVEMEGGQFINKYPPNSLYQSQNACYRLDNDKLLGIKDSWNFSQDFVTQLFVVW